MAYFGDQDRLAQSEEQEQISLDNAHAMADYENRVNEYNSRPLPNDWNSWGSALKRQEEQKQQVLAQEQNARKAEQMNASRGVLNNYIRSGLQLEKLAMDQMSARDDHIASAMKLAGANGGMIPKYMMPGLNNAFGLDGKTAGVYGGGFKKDGSGFFIAVAETDPNTGRLVPRAVQLDRKQMYDLMLSKPGIFTRGEMQAVRNKYAEDYMKNNPGSKPLPEVPPDYGQVGDVGVGNRTETGGTAVPSSWLYGPRRHSAVSAFSANGRGGFTRMEQFEDANGNLVRQEERTGTSAENHPGNWKVLSKGPDPDGDGKAQITRYENDKTGEVIDVRDGETLRDKIRGVSDKERVAAINADSRVQAAEARAQGGTNGMSEERIQLERERLAQRKSEEEGRNARAGAKNTETSARIAANMARNATDIMRGMHIDVENKEARDKFQKGLQQVVMDFIDKNSQDATTGGAQGDKAGVKSSDTMGHEKEKSKNGEKTVTGYRYNKSRTKRIPVYSDGTQGEIETIK